MEAVREWLERWHPIADWLVAVGTVLLGILAVFATRIERWWRYPKLFITGDTRFVWDSHPADGHRILVLLCLENRGGLAKNAEVFLQSVAVETPGKENVTVDGIVPMSFRWIHREADKPEVFVTISGGMRRYFMLGALKLRSISEGTVYFQLFTESRLTPRSDELEPGQYILDVSVSAADAKPKSLEILLEVHSEFRDPEVRCL